MDHNSTRYGVELTRAERIGMAVDNVIGIFSPAIAASRIQKRIGMATYRELSSSGYRGSGRDRLRNKYWETTGSADDDLLDSLPAMRGRSRAYYQGDAYAAAAINTTVVNVVGTGIRPQCSIDAARLGLTEEQAAEYQKAAERGWQRWSPYADAGNRNTVEELQDLIFRQILLSGEVLVLPLMLKDEPGRPYYLAHEVIEADRLETPPDKKSDATIRDGVKLGERGQPLQYYVRKTHPGDSQSGRLGEKSTTYSVIKARNEFGRPNIFHLYWQKRPGQTRGEPFFAPVLDLFANLASLNEARLVRARVAACFAVFITKTDVQSSVANLKSNKQGERLSELQPAIVEYLQHGEDVKFANPQMASSGEDAFVLECLRAIGAALGMPIELLLKDFSRVNYASARAAILEARRFFLWYRAWLNRHYNQPTYEMLMEEMALRGELPGNPDVFGPMRDEWMKARWIAPGWGWVDPVKEVESSQMAVDGGYSTLADEAASQGKDWEEVAVQRAREKRRYEELGLPDPGEKKPKTAPQQDAGGQGPQDQGKQEETA